MSADELQPTEVRVSDIAPRVRLSPLRKGVRTVWLLAVVAGLSTACGSTEPEDTSHLGTYALVSVAGREVPALLSDTAGVRVVLASGSLGLRADGLARLDLLYRVTEGEATADDSRGLVGIHTRSGNTVVISWNNGGADALTFDEAKRELSATVDGVTSVFRM